MHLNENRYMKHLLEFSIDVVMRENKEKTLFCI